MRVSRSAMGLQAETYTCFPTPCNHDLYSDYLVEGVCFCAPLKLESIRIMYII